MAEAETETNISGLVAGRENWTKRAELEQSEADVAEQVQAYLTDPQATSLIKSYIDRKRTKAESYRKLAYAAAQAIEGLQKAKNEAE